MEDITLTKWFKVKEYDQKSEQRSEKHKGLRGRNNVTSCRSPTRELDTRWIKKELRRKRQQEFNIRRSVSPESAKDSGKVKDDSCVICDTAKSETVGAKVSVTPKSNLHGSQRAKDSAKVKDDSCVICDEAKTESLQCNISWPMPPGLMSNVRPLTMGRRIKTSTDDLDNSEWASIWKNEKSSTRTLEAVSSTFTTFTTSTREPPTSTFTTSTREPPTFTFTTSTREPPTSSPTICTSTREPPTSTPTTCTCTSTREPPTSTPTTCTCTSTREPPSPPQPSAPRPENPHLHPNHLHLDQRTPISTPTICTSTREPPSPPQPSAPRPENHPSPPQPTP
uniref:proteoglycan 4-like n=1 Tax=Oncorhynchus gorbuscha TaxID=8017 RepID=UPI001EAF7C2B|nr:proteoglycan 4-like [Oncorhynchus gorbuscha]